MDPTSRADNARGVREEIQRMALSELRNAKQLTQAYLAEMLDAPQSSISRIEQRADMYVSTLRDYVHAMGGVLQIQAIFPDGGTIAINRFGDYEDRSYVVQAQVEGGAVYKLYAKPLDHGTPLFTKALKAPAFKKTLKALHLPDREISAIRSSVDEISLTEIGGRLARRVFSEPELIAAGFEADGGDEV
jgi:hypothetical protein